MSEVSFGVFDWIDRGTQPLSQLYEDRLQLLAAAERDAVDRGRKAMRLEARADDRAALAFYESSGYRCIGRRPGYYGGRVGALRLDKPLVEKPRRLSRDLYESR